MNIGSNLCLVRPYGALIYAQSGPMGLVLMPDDGFGLGLGKGIKARSGILDVGVELDLGLWCYSSK